MRDIERLQSEGCEGLGSLARSACVALRSDQEKCTESVENEGCEGLGSLARSACVALRSEAVRRRAQHGGGGGATFDDPIILKRIAWIC